MKVHTLIEICMSHFCSRSECLALSTSALFLPVIYINCAGVGRKSPPPSPFSILSLLPGPTAPLMFPFRSLVAPGVGSRERLK